nr:unnamed protein product [Digitaria exilis]
MVVLPRPRLSNRYSTSNGCCDLVERITRPLGRRILVCGRVTREVLWSSSNPRTLGAVLQSESSVCNAPLRVIHAIIPEYNKSAHVSIV